MEKSSAPLKLIQSKGPAAFPHLRNWLALALLTALYSSVVMATAQGNLHLLVAPLLIAPLGYHAFKGRPLIKKVLPAVVPWTGAPILGVLGFDGVGKAALIHSFLIGMVVVQVWEASIWLGRYVFNHVCGSSHRVSGFADAPAAEDGDSKVVHLDSQSRVMRSRQGKEH